MNTWIDYTKHTRHDIKRATNGVAIRLSNNSTKTVLDKKSMLHYINYDCTALVKQFRIL